MFDRTDYPYSETFVREAIQNSLDARLDPTKPVIVNFTFHSDGIGSRRVFLEQVMDHRKKAGLDIPPEWFDGHVRWLVVEDFNSKGLGGSLSSRISDFWNYWLNFGLSNKDGSGRGGRGIGRVTFLIASRLQSVIGYTRRAEDGSSAICGMAVLRAQEDGDDLKSTHAYLAEGENGNIYTLHNSPEFRSRTRSAFAFTGYDGEYQSGLGLAILYPHAELKAGGILAAAIENFAPAIMNGSLVLNVDGRVLDASSIDEVSLDVERHLNDEAIGADVARYLGLLRLAQDEVSPHAIMLPSAQKSDFEVLRKTPVIKALQKKIAEEQVVTLKVVFPLVRKGNTKDVFLKAVIGPAAAGKRPIDRLFREGMSLPDVRAKSPGELDLVMLVGEGELATYLNFCEGKAHLDLLESKDVKQKLQEHGFDGPRVKRLVKSLPAELRLLLTPATHVEFWQAKFAQNTARDARALAALIQDGWPNLLVVAEERNRGSTILAPPRSSTTGTSSLAPITRMSASIVLEQLQGSVSSEIAFPISRSSSCCSGSRPMLRNSAISIRVTVPPAATLAS